MIGAFLVVLDLASFFSILLALESQDQLVLAWEQMAVAFRGPAHPLKNGFAAAW